MLIAVGDQRRERVHMVRVLYHWNLIRLRGREEQTEERERKTTILILVLGDFLGSRSGGSGQRGAIEFWVLWRCQTSEPQRKQCGFVIKTTSAVSPWNSLTQYKWLWGLPVHIWA